MPEWNHIKKKIPEMHLSLSGTFNWESDRVLVCGPSYGISIACYYADEGAKRFWWWDRRNGTELDGITHWMYLPEYPSFSEEDYPDEMKVFVVKNYRTYFEAMKKAKEGDTILFEFGCKEEFSRE